MTTSYHNPVLLNESIEGLKIRPNGTYLDMTFGGGGHSRQILNNLSKGRLFAFDQDMEAKKNIFNDNRFKLIHSNFRYVKRFLKLEKIIKVDGVIADLGVSSFQIDTPSRGFSFRYDAELDMRMNVLHSLTAKEIINNYKEEKLAQVFYEYGELRNSKKIANQIVNTRKKSSISTTNELVSCISHLSTNKKKNQFLARVFQSLRIEVNEEVDSLKDMLISAVELLKKNGRIVVLSYHSIEDKLVKNLFKKGNFTGDLQKDFYGNIKKSLKEVNKKVIIADDKELLSNPRARSAKLRIAEKI